jgi:hypothetical protein
MLLSGQNHVRIDEGAFGSIDKADYRGNQVVVKQVQQVCDDCHEELSRFSCAYDKSLFAHAMCIRQQDVSERKTLPQILRETLLEVKIGAC